MSPEQVRTQPLDARSDIFGCAVLLYEIITGANPFAEPSPTATLAHVLEREVDPDPRIEPRVWLEIQRSLAKQPYQRHASAKELAAALASAIGETENALVSSLRRDVESLPLLDSVSDASSELEVLGRSLSAPDDALDPSGTRSNVVPMRSAKPLVFVAGGAVAFVLVVVVGYSLLRSPARSEPTHASSATATATPATTASATAAATASVAPAASSSATTLELDPTTPPSGAPPSSVAGGDRAEHHPFRRPSGPAALSPRGSGAATAKSLARTPGF